MPQHDVMHATEAQPEKTQRPFSSLRRFTRRDRLMRPQSPIGIARTGDAVFSLFQQEYEAIVLDLPFPDMEATQVVASIRYLEKELKRKTRSVLIAVSSLEATTPLPGVDAVLYVKRDCEG